MDKIINHEIEFLKRGVWIAARDGRADRIVDLLRKAHSKNDVEEILNYHKKENGQSTTPLMIAVCLGHEVVVNVLLIFGVDLERKGTVIYDGNAINGVTALWCASCWGHYNILRILVDNGANVNNPTDIGSTPLRVACYFDDKFEIVKYLVEKGADVNAKNIYKSTCMMKIGYTGNYDIAQYLLKKGADPNKKDVDGETALHCSAAYGHLAISKLFIASGVPVMDTDNFGITALMKAAVNGKTDVVDFLSAFAECSREDRLDAIELLGTSSLFREDFDILEKYRHLMTAMQERYKDQNEIIPKRVPPMSLVQAITGKKECETYSELIDLRHDELTFCIEAIHICERVLGTENHEVTHPLIYTGCLFADYGDYDKCIDLLLYASKICQNIDKVCDMERFPKCFAEMLHGGILINFSSLLNCFHSAEIELRLNKDRMRQNEANYREYYEIDILTCMYLIGIMLLTYTSKNEEYHLNQAVYNFIHQKTRLQNGFTPLHMCCDSDTNDNDIDVEDEILFPNVLICKALVACGADVNAQDNNRNTPLHIIAKCVDVELDTRREIIKCLIDNGAHVDACIIDGKTAADIASTDIVKSIIKARETLSLKCLSARTLRKHKIEYQGIIPNSLIEFVEFH